MCRNFSLGAEALSGEEESIPLLWVNRLMEARRQVGAAKKANHSSALRDARAAVNAAKYALGERGPVWWDDGEPDFNRHLVKNTPYAAWYQSAVGDS